MGVSREGCVVQPCVCLQCVVYCYIFLMANDKVIISPLTWFVIILIQIKVAYEDVLFVYFHLFVYPHFNYVVNGILCVLHLVYIH